MSRIRYERADSLLPHPMLERVGTMVSLANHFQIRAGKAGKNRLEHKERAAEMEGDLAAITESVRTHGILEPIKICRIPDDDESPRPLGVEWWIADGRNRWTAASFLKLKRVPVIRIRTEDAPGVIAATVAARRHYTKGATAYLAILLNPEAATAGEQRAKAGQPSALSAGGLAAKFSVSPRLLEQAAELYRLLEGEGKPWRTDAEAEIWSGAGLGAVKAGLRSLIETGKRDGSEQSAEAKRLGAAWKPIIGGCKALTMAWERWSDLGADQRELATARLAETLAGAPEELLRSLRATI